MGSIYPPARGPFVNADSAARSAAHGVDDGYPAITFVVQIRRRRRAFVARLAMQLLIDESERTLRLGVLRQLESERTPLAEGGCHRQRAMKQLGQSARDRKSQTGPVLQLRFPELDEFLEDPFSIRLGDSFALIDDADRDAAVVDRLGDDLNGFAAPELDGVRQKIEQDLTKSSRIRDDADRLFASVVEGERRAVFVGERSHRDEQIFDERREFDRLQAKLDLARLDLGEIEHVVHQLEQ